LDKKETFFLRGLQIRILIEKALLFQLIDRKNNLGIIYFFTLFNTFGMIERKYTEGISIWLN
jgi:hypothetical protein